MHASSPSTTDLDERRVPWLAPCSAMRASGASWGYLLQVQENQGRGSRPTLIETTSSSEALPFTHLMHTSGFCALVYNQSLRAARDHEFGFWVGQMGCRRHGDTRVRIQHRVTRHGYSAEVQHPPLSIACRCWLGVS